MTLRAGRWFKQTVVGLPGKFWYLWLGTLINRVGIFVLPFLTLFLTRQQGFSPYQAAFVVSLFGIGSFLAQFVGGYLSDAWGRRPTMLLSLFGTPVVLMILSRPTSFGLTAVITLCLGLFTDIYRPASSAIIADTVPPDDRRRAFSLRYWAINLGAAIRLSLGGWLASQNYQLLFIGDALTTLGFGVVTFLAIPETRPARQPKISTQQNNRRVPILQQLRRDFADEGALLSFTLLFAMPMLVVSSVYFQSSVTLPLAMTANHLTEADYGNVVALNGIVIVLVSLTVNQMMSRHSPLVAMAGGALLIGAGFGLYALTTSKIMYAAGVVIWTFGELMGSPVSPTILAHLSPPHRRGFYQGMIGAVWGLAAFVGPNVGGALYNQFGQTVLWVCCFFACVLAAAVYLLVIRPLYDRLNAQAAEYVPVETQAGQQTSVDPL